MRKNYTIRESLKLFSLRHKHLLGLYRATFGKIKTKLYFNAQRKALQSNARPLLKRLDKALVGAGAEYFLDCGTLLGFVRDNGPISNDRDLDLGIWFDNRFTPENLIELLEALGLKKVSVGRFRDEIQEITFSNGITNIDFFRHTEVGEESLLYVFYRDVSIKYPSNKHYSIICERRKHILGITRTSVGGIEVNIPSNAESYLESAYSENWRIPDPNWRYTMEPGCTYMDGFGIRE